MTVCFPKIQAIEITMEFQQLPRQTETWARRRLGGSATVDLKINGVLERGINLTYHHLPSPNPSQDIVTLSV